MAAANVFIVRACMESGQTLCWGAVTMGDAVQVLAVEFFKLAVGAFEVVPHKASAELKLSQPGVSFDFPMDFDLESPGELWPAFYAVLVDVSPYVPAIKKLEIEYVPIAFRSPAQILDWN